MTGALIVPLDGVGPFLGLLLTVLAKQGDHVLRQRDHAPPGFGLQVLEPTVTAHLLTHA